jgi:hypothetical protein
MNVEQILEKLSEYKGLPTYQFERRLDPFIMLYLGDVFNDKFGATDFRMIYPEFPMFTNSKTGELNKSDKRATYCDYLMYSRSLRQLIMLEYKTDNSSIGEIQFNNYISNCKEGWQSLWLKYIDNAKTNKKPSYRAKYVYGLKHIHKSAPELSGYLAHDDYTSTAPNFVNLGLPALKMAFLAPSVCEAEITKWQEAYDPEKKHYAGFISLKEMAQFTPDALKKILLGIEEH